MMQQHYQTPEERNEIKVVGGKIIQVPQGHKAANKGVLPGCPGHKTEIMRQNDTCCMIVVSKWLKKFVFLLQFLSGMRIEI